MNTAAEAQQLRVAYDTPEFTEYEFQNDSLKISAPLFLDVPFVNGQRRYRIIEQSFERRPVGEAETQPQSSALTRQLSPEAEQQLRSVLQSSDIPFIQAGTPQEHRKQLKSTLTINASRLDERQNEYIIARSLRIRVYKEQSWSPQARQKAAELADKNESTPHPLSSGQWYKIPILRSGIYRLDADYLSDLGLNVETLDPEKIQLWGMAGNELPRPNSVARPEFSQLPIRVEGEADGSFGDNDAVVFYAKDVNERIFDPEARSWSHKIHAYADTNFVFLKVGEENGRRLSPYQSSGQIEREIDRFRDFLWLEEELYMPEANHRSGTLWFGQLFTPEFSQQVIMQDTLPGFIEGSSITFDARMAGRSRSVGNFNFSLNGANFGSASVSPITNLNSSTGRAANVSNVFRQINGVSLPENDQFEISASYSVATAESRGWVDYITLRAERLLAPKNGILHFLTPDDAPLNPTGPARYTFTGFNGQPLVMDVTNPVEPVLIEASGSGGNWSAEYRYDAGRQLVAATRFYTPAPGRAVSNQHISGNRDFPDYLIITDESLLEQAEELAAYRRSQNGFVTSIVTQRQIFNEFSGGVPDPVAIRDYVKHLYDVAGLNEDQLPDYLLLMGNASFDYKGIEDGVPMRNLVFNFQHYVDSDNLGRVGTYGSDDYFGFLDENEGQWRSFNQQNRMDLKIGRLPVQTPEQAELVIEKIKTFENAEQRGDWRTLFTFTADNHLNSSSNDRDLHAYNADFTAETIDEDESGIRLRKLYQFSFPVENTPAGQRVPQATDALVRQINEGTLVVNFSGHGSEQTLTQQRLFQSSDIPRLTNRERPMIMITATCSFGRYDDNTDFSGAEKLILHENGGSVASMTTSRVVFTSTSPSNSGDNNFVLNIELTRQMTSRNPDGSPRTIGEVFMQTKNNNYEHIDSGNSSNSINSRKFVLLGDPAMRLGLPEQDIQITSINGIEEFDDAPLQLRSLDRVQIEGRVVNPNGQPDPGFTGEGNVRVFDASRFEELPDPETTCRFLDDCSFRVQNDVLFNGRVSITNGEFSTEFIIPRDIAYSDSLARIHVYGNGQGEAGYDAVGSFSNFILNGRNEEAENIFDGPRLDVYLNDESFVNGSLTNPDPILYADIFSEAGVNTTGAGVGHEITATLINEDRPGEEETFILNNFYESELDDFTRGQIAFPLDNLPDGRYALRVRAWDVFNNVGETEVYFEVAGGDALSIRNVYNYPNPMHNVTRFAFEHNQPAGQPLDVFIRVYTLSGRPVAQIRESVIAGGNLEMFEWHGRDDDNNRLAAGTYLYHLRVRTDGLQGRQSREKIERLVIIR